MESCSQKKYPETKKLRQVGGVGPLVVLAYVLTLGDHKRFRRSRDVGAYVELVPKEKSSGQCRPQMRITKAGNRYLRQLLVTSAHYILNSRSEDSALRRHGLKIADRGGKNAKKRAVVAVARKLSVVLHRLWASDRDYQPLQGIV